MKRSSTWATPWTSFPWPGKPKAIDMTDMEALVISYDMQSPQFKRIAAGAPAQRVGRAFSRTASTAAGC
jgi:hypothetical protein